MNDERGRLYGIIELTGTSYFRMAMLNGQPMFGDPCGPWIKTFAWWPRFTFDGGTVWLRHVWKQHIFKHQHLYGGADYWWQYRRFAP